MLKALQLQKKIKLENEKRSAIMRDFEELQKRETEIEERLDAAETETEIDEIDADIEQLNSEKEELLEKIAKIDETIADLETEQAGLEEKSNKVSQERKGENKMEIRKQYEQFIRTKGQERTGLKSSDAGVLIPIETLKPLREESDVVDLRKYITVQKVTTKTGKIPVLASDTTNKFSTVEELAANPELAKLKVKEVAFEIATYRGAIPISKEMIDDAEIDVVEEVNKHINELEVNTSNAKIIEVLKTFTPKAIRNADDLKNVINKDLKKVGKNVIICSKSFFAEVDLWKDKNGRYLLNDNLAKETDGIVSGLSVEAVEDELFGEAGNKSAFIGNAKKAAIYFDRQEVHADWVDSEIYGRRLMGGMRMDVKKQLENVGVFATIS